VCAVKQLEYFRKKSQYDGLTRPDSQSDAHPVLFKRFNPRSSRDSPGEQSLCRVENYLHNFFRITPEEVTRHYPDGMPKKPIAVDDALDARAHPMREQIDLLRRTSLSIDPAITEEWKWNAPSFRIGDDYLYTFMLRPDDHLHLVVHHPAAPEVSSELLEGDYADGRRMVYLRSADEVTAKLPELTRVLKELVGRSL
jgi:hypothetical protein